jgi:hypothetical protein
MLLFLLKDSGKHYLLFKKQSMRAMLKSEHLLPAGFSAALALESHNRIATTTFLWTALLMCSEKRFIATVCSGRSKKHKKAICS